ncbi:MAG: hypothetical protein CK529_02460 [Rhodospirillaceae bacterium]|nr:MAG: hypothetical protein CK529_02460 [Rhodospirillaceae bacterium]
MRFRQALHGDTADLVLKRGRQWFGSCIESVVSFNLGSRQLTFDLARKARAQLSRAAADVQIVLFQKTRANILQGVARVFWQALSVGSAYEKEDNHSNHCAHGLFPR